MDKKLSKEDYLRILRDKRSKTSDGKSDYSDKVLYKGKLMGRCPSGTTRQGNTCVPGQVAPQQDKMKQKDLGGITPLQARLLSQGKKRPSPDQK